MGKRLESRKIEEQYCHRDGLMEEEIERMILNSGLESLDDETEDTETGDTEITAIFQQKQLREDLGTCLQFPLYSSDDFLDRYLQRCI
jgi:hypothetical protein